MSFEVRSVRSIEVQGFEGEVSHNLREAVKKELAQYNIKSGHVVYEALFSPHTEELKAVLRDHDSSHDKAIRITNSSHELIIVFHNPDGLGVQWIVVSECFERIKTKQTDKLSYAEKLNFSGWELCVYDSMVSDSPYWEVRAYRTERVQ